MAEKPIIPETFVVEHYIDIPEEVAGFKYSPKPGIDTEASFGGAAEVEEGAGTDVVTDPNAEVIKPGEGGLPFPKGLVVLSQDIRETKDGSQVVDVTFKVSPVKGATEYEIRVTRA